MDTLAQLSDLNLFEADEHAWLWQQVELLRRGDLDRLDRNSLIEFLESMGRRDIRKLRSRLTILVQHLLKVSHQPSRHTRSWNMTVLTQQQELRALLHDWPSVAARREELLAAIYPDAVALASAETGLPKSTFSAAAPWTVDEALEFAPPPPPSPVVYRQKR